MRRGHWALAAVIAALILSASTYEPGIYKSGSPTLGGCGVVPPDEGEPEDVGASFTLSSADQITYTFVAAITGPATSATWYWGDGDTDSGTPAEMDTIQHTFEPGAYTITLVVQDEGDKYDVATTELVRRDVRGVEVAHNQTTFASQPEQWPRIMVDWGPGLGGGLHPNEITDYSDEDLLATMDLVAANAQAIQISGSRGLTALGQAFVDSMRARNPALQVHLYTRHAHAPLDTDLASQPLSTAEQFAGPLIYRAETVGQQFTAFNAAGDTAYIWGGETPWNEQAAIWNHFVGKGPEDVGGFDNALVTEYADSVASMVNRYPDSRIDLIMVDYLSDAPGIYVPATGLYNGGVNFDGVGGNDYENYAWSNGPVEQAWYNWGLAWLTSLRADFPYSRIVPNGNMYDGTQDFAKPYGATLRTLIDGWNYEIVGITGGDAAGFPNTLERLTHCAALADAYGKRWSRLETAATPSLSSAEIARISMVFSLVSGSWVQLQGSKFDSLAELEAAFDALDIAPLRLPQAMVYDATSEPGFVTLSRRFDVGLARARFNASTGWPTVPYSSSVRFDYYPVTADFTVSTADQLSYDFADASTSELPLANLTWDADVLGGAIYHFGPTWSVTFAAGQDSVLVSHGASNQFTTSVSSKWVPIADPPPELNQPPEAVLVALASSDSLTWPFNASGSRDPDGTIVSYRVDYGDGQSETKATASFEHTYGYFGGTRTARLIVTDNDGAADTTTVGVYVKAAPSSPGTPTISGVTGTLSEGEVVTISGAGFGTKTNAATLYFEDFEAGYRDSTQVWGHVDSNPGSVSRSWVVPSATVSARHDRDDYNLYTNYRGSANTESYPLDFYDGGVTSQRWFESFFVYLDPVTWDWPSGANGAFEDQGNVKVFRYYNANNRFDPSPGANLFSGGGGSQTFTLCDMQGVTSFWSANSVMGAGVWHQLEHEVDLTAGGRQRIWIDGVLISENTTCLGVTSGTATWSRELLGLCSVRDLDADDDISVMDDAYSDRSWARVCLGNADTFDGCTIREWQPITAWADGEITVTLNQGSFDSEANAWVYVVTEDGTVSAARAVALD